MTAAQNPVSPNWTRRRWLALSGLIAAGFGAGGATARPQTPAPLDAAAGGKTPINVAVVLGAHNTLIDFAGPWEVFSSASYAGVPGFNVYSVADTRAPVNCDDGRGLGGMGPVSGLTVVPDYSFDNAPQPRITIMGGQIGGGDDRKLEWIRHAAKKADLTASVCTGAFVLAKTGLLDGRSATTNRNAYDQFEKKFPMVKLIRGVRFVESGPVSTATGLTAGIDLALRITERFYGHKASQDLADYEEWTSMALIV